VTQEQVLRPLRGHQDDNVWLRSHQDDSIGVRSRQDDTAALPIGLNTVRTNSNGSEKSDG
jgi:hypothetical protein